MSKRWLFGIPAILIVTGAMAADGGALKAAIKEAQL